MDLKILAGGIILVVAIVFSIFALYRTPQQTEIKVAEEKAVQTEAATPKIEISEVVSENGKMSMRMKNLGTYTYNLEKEISVFFGDRKIELAGKFSPGDVLLVRSGVDFPSEGITVPIKISSAFGDNIEYNCTFYTYKMYFC